MLMEVCYNGLNGFITLVLILHKTYYGNVGVLYYGEIKSYVFNNLSCKIHNSQFLSLIIKYYISNKQI